MKWENTFIALYLYIFERKELRMRNHHRPRFTDEEFMMVYLFLTLCFCALHIV